MESLKIGSGLWVFGGTLDRYCVGGYQEFKDINGQIIAASKVPGLEAVEILDSSFKGTSIKTVNDLLHNNGLEVSRSLSENRY